mmetsp:Transcript_20404/g.43742  ORF Transcript_20404/g.43742 Transcript_20404/m.43742 type:complete len:150 (+) Transcript_20404:327-776(+)|eukprot:CAMPEP_0172560728 /NCGR_PEP_ID=MMETSP1067-20121228/89945_1 /TAXON_ID=265564 ORGANISM="Thalassiosira punctigera, Strain Tpunct2005C2" /NCGR_SAMPLE_ID=MMETSP1067 /ASSEMBLY_ACC=CAM_ASM_000444 /LENGTH=149 /DNA_ID=CAMNT_0013350587 /DNA_START=320 /DNA_END=769 /DNA_ORIENTATION=+
MKAITGILILFFTTTVVADLKLAAANEEPPKLVNAPILQSDVMSSYSMSDTALKVGNDTDTMPVKMSNETKKNCTASEALPSKECFIDCTKCLFFLHGDCNITTAKGCDKWGCDTKCGSFVECGCNSGSKVKAATVIVVAIGSLIGLLI